MKPPDVSCSVRRGHKKITVCAYDPGSRTNPDRIVNDLTEIQNVAVTGQVFKFDYFSIAAPRQECNRLSAASQTRPRRLIFRITDVLSEIEKIPVAISILENPHGDGRR